MKKVGIFVYLLLRLGCWCAGQDRPILPDADTFYRIAFYNAENFFDCLHDSGKNDHDFTPHGIKGWGNAKYTQKRNRLFKVIAALNAECPLAAMGMAEVENDRVLRNLCRGTPLRSLHFDFVHFESRDPRGIDVALLYRKDLLHIDTAYVYPLIVPPDSLSHTRDILYVRARLRRSALVSPRNKASDSSKVLHLLVNHFPSKYGGARETDGRRGAAAQLLRRIMDSIRAADPQAFILTMGDFNTEPNDPVLQDLAAPPYVNLMSAKTWTKTRGSHKFRENWSTIDHIYLNRRWLPSLRAQKAFLFDRDFLLMPDEKYLGEKPFRTFYGATYLGGYSDHLPVYVDVAR